MGFTRYYFYFWSEKDGLQSKQDFKPDSNGFCRLHEYEIGTDLVFSSSILKPLEIWLTFEYKIDLRFIMMCSKIWIFILANIWLSTIYKKRVHTQYFLVAYPVSNSPIWVWMQCQSQYFSIFEYLWSSLHMDNN